MTILQGLRRRHGKVSESCFNRGRERFFRKLGHDGVADRWTRWFYLSTMASWFREDGVALAINNCRLWAQSVNLQSCRYQVYRRRDETVMARLINKRGIGLCWWALSCQLIGWHFRKRHLLRGSYSDYRAQKCYILSFFLEIFWSSQWLFRPNPETIFFLSQLSSKSPATWRTHSYNAKSKCQQIYQAERYKSMGASMRTPQLDSIIPSSDLRAGHWRLTKLTLCVSPSLSLLFFAALSVLALPLVQRNSEWVNVQV